MTKDIKQQLEELRNHIKQIYEEQLKIRKELRETKTEMESHIQNIETAHKSR